MNKFEELVASVRKLDERKKEAMARLKAHRAGLDACARECSDLDNQMHAAWHELQKHLLEGRDE